MGEQLEAADSATQLTERDSGRDTNCWGFIGFPGVQSGESVMHRSVVALVLLLGTGCVVPLHTANQADAFADTYPTAEVSDTAHLTKSPDFNWQEFKDDATLTLMMPYLVGRAAIYFTTGWGGPPL